ncbi:MAG: RND family transporter [Desulfobacterales bacterium]|nr:RND family transporter [Desulfobacterales bacterium]
MKSFLDKVTDAIFNVRPFVILFFLTCTVLFAWSASYIRLDAGFEKNIPLLHEYMKTFTKHQVQFGGANRIVVALHDKRGDIFNPEFFNALMKVTDELFFIEGVDRSKVSSLFTPDTMYIEVVEDGFSGGLVIPSDFRPTKEGLERVKKNTIKAGIVGRLVSNDFSCAMVSAQLLDVNPVTKEKVDYLKIARQLEEKIRSKYETENISIHIIGFAKMVGDVADGARGVILFFGIAILITCILVYIYSRSIELTALPIFCSLVAVVWQLGIFNAIGFGMDPMAILVPFLVFAIGVSHGMQMINGVANGTMKGLSTFESAKVTFGKLLIPGGVAVISDTAGFLTLLLIKIGIIQELAINASIGVGVIIFTNLILLPILLSYLHLDDKFKKRFERTSNHLEKLWLVLNKLSNPKNGVIAVVIGIILFGLGLWKGLEMKIGDLHAGEPSLREEARYNQDINLIVSKFSVGVDSISIICETVADACTKYETIEIIDKFHWYMENVPGVKSVISLAQIAKIINAGYNEGNMKWRVLSRNSSIMTQSTTPIKSGSGLLNTNCSVMPVIIFTEDHKANTIETIVSEVKKYSAENPSELVNFRLATGPVGVMAAKNEAVKEAQNPMLVWVYAVVISLCIITFWSFSATICVIIPLIIVSALAQALMTLLNMGLTVSTLPVLALGVGIGVDYGIYIISPLRQFMKDGFSLQEAYLKTLKTTGSAVLFTGLTLAIGVSTWIFSALKFQADIGVLLTFMFFLNMIGAVILLPALAGLFWGNKQAISSKQVKIKRK